MFHGKLKDKYTTYEQKIKNKRIQHFRKKGNDNRLEKIRTYANDGCGVSCTHLKRLLHPYSVLCQSANSSLTIDRFNCQHSIVRTQHTIIITNTYQKSKRFLIQDCIINVIFTYRIITCTNDKLTIRFTSFHKQTVGWVNRTVNSLQNYSR